MMQIIDTTDGRYKGLSFDKEDNPIQLSYDVFFRHDKTERIGNVIRYSSANYVIDAMEV